MKTFKEKLKNIFYRKSGEVLMIVLFQFTLFFITFHLFRVLKKIDPNLSFFQKISQIFQIVFQKTVQIFQTISSFILKEWLICLNVICGLLAFCSFFIVCIVIIFDVFIIETKNKGDEKNGKELFLKFLKDIIMLSLPFLFIIPIGFINPDFMKFGIIAFATFAFSKIVMEGIMVEFNFSGINLDNPDNNLKILNTYDKIDKIKNLRIKIKTTRDATTKEKLQAIFFEVILCLPSFAVEFLIETILKGIGKGTELIVDGVSALKDLVCGNENSTT